MSIALPGLAVESAQLVLGGETIALGVSAGGIVVHADALLGVDKTAGVVKCEVVVNGDTHLPCEIIANPNKPNRN